MLNKYPKIRPTLSRDFAAIYASYYKANRGGHTVATALAKRMESWLHIQVAKDIHANCREMATLEIGAGTLNQLDYEPKIGPYDIVEPFKDLYENSKLLDQIRNVYSDINEIVGNKQYDRITSIATFEHICNLPEVIAKAGILLKDKGSLCVSIPSEGSILWALGWKLTTGLEFRIKYGLDYGELMRFEHVNSASEIEYLLRFFFKDVTCTFFGLTKSFSFYQYYRCVNPNLEKCEIYIEHQR